MTVAPAARVRDAVISAGRQGIRSYGVATASQRPLPEFLVIGAKRGGSTSFYFDLLANPHVVPLFPSPTFLPKRDFTKGVHYFDSNFHRGTRWYRSHFPSHAVRALARRRAHGPVVTGEASPYYLFHPAAPGRAASLLPDVKLIAVLRDPVERTYSHWKERRRSGGESLSFADALAAEADRVGNDHQRLAEEPGFASYAHEQLSYAAQSEYGPALLRWLAEFARERLLILLSEDFYRDGPGQLAAAAEFLGVPAGSAAAGGEVRNAAPGEDIPSALRRELAARFAESNTVVERLLGRTLPWS